MIKTLCSISAMGDITINYHGGMKMKAIKRTLALLLAVVTAVSVLAGCASQQTADVKKEDLYFSKQEVRESDRKSVV